LGAWYHRAVRSMTGYGRGVSTQNGTRATVDARSVNHRFLDLKLRGAASPALEEMVSTKTRAALERGAVSISIHLVRETVVSTRIDADAAKAAHQVLSQLATTLGVEPPSLSLVLSQPGVVTGDDRDDDASLPAVAAALDAALAQLGEMRVREGAALATELTTRLRDLDALRAQIATLAAGVPQAIAKRLGERIKRLLEDPTAIDPQRIAQEVAQLADRADVTEELVRLASHLEQARALIAGKEAAGRRLDFLVQEIGRELNTIGSKSTLAEITSAVVEAKAVLEKVREQVQNVE
jgi:uncharacterized protein (TIGR00255 family)